MRVKAILRRSGRQKQDQGNSVDKSGDMGTKQESLSNVVDSNKNQIIISDITLDLDSQSVVKDGESIPLTYTEFKILELLATHKKKIYSLDNIYQSIWEEEAVGDSAIMVHIKNIRKKLGDNSRDPKYIKTAWGRGYYIEG